MYCEFFRRGATATLRDSATATEGLVSNPNPLRQYPAAKKKMIRSKNEKAS